MKPAYIIIVIFLMITCFCLGDVVNTKDGNSYEGVITEVRIRTEDGDEYGFEGNDISSIELSSEEEITESEEEEVTEEPEESEEEPPLEEETVEESEEFEKEVEKAPEEEPSPEKKPLIIGPQIKGLDEGSYKTY